MTKEIDSEGLTAIADWMEAFDELLAQQDVPLPERPLRAAVLLVRYAVVNVHQNGVDEPFDDTMGFGELLHQRWFGRLVRVSDDWYAKTFGAAALRSPDPSASAVIFHRGVLQRMDIPLVLEQPDEVPYRKWIAFPDHVENDEDVLSWIQPAIDTSRIRPDELVALASQAKRIAGSVRFIASRARNASRGPEALRGLLAGTVRNLQAFVQLAILGDRLERQKAWWELQMANESFLKAFCLQKGRPGGYRRIHSLADLMRDAQAVGLVFGADQLAAWPTESEMSDYRYATGRRVTSSELFSGYEFTLTLCQAVAAQLDVKFDTGKGRILIQPLPWRLRELEEPRP